MSGMRLDTSVSQLHGVGKVLEKRLAHLGIVTVRDLLMYFPFRYEDYSTVILIAQARDGEQITIHGAVALIANKRSARRRTIMTEAIVSDESGQMQVIWFGQPFLI